MTGHDSSSSLASSFTDLMTSLAVIFILLLVATLNNAQQGGVDIRNAILDRLRAELHLFAKEGVQVTADPRDPLALLVIVPEGLLNFEVAKSDVPAGGTEFLHRFIPRFARVMSDAEIRSQVNAIVVEGHTDSRGSEETNLKLSQDRSLAVVLESMAVLSDDPVAREGFVKLLSATGRGKADLILRDDDTEDSDRSRRVVFKIRLRSLEQKTIKEVLSSV